jgi:exodeoxyribonuclease V beta subunit
MTTVGSERDDRIDDALIDSSMATDQRLPVSKVIDAALVAKFNEFPAGSTYGTLLHDLLEWQFQHGWPIAQEVTSVALDREWASLLARKSQRLNLNDDQRALMDDWLRNIAQTRLTWGGSAEDSRPLTLGAIDNHTGWAEMAFTLPVQHLSARHLDTLIGQHVLPGCTRNPLQPLQLEGMLIGFMDMVLEHEGRYFVLDYKSNRLASYEPLQMQQAILAHRYDVQYTLYVLALHRLLKSRIPDYEYDRHIGGAVYLFLRGIDQPGAGVFFDRPPRELIETMDHTFAQTALESEVTP